MLRVREGSARIPLRMKDKASTTGSSFLKPLCHVTECHSMDTKMLQRGFHGGYCMCGCWKVLRELCACASSSGLFSGGCSSLGETELNATNHLRHEAK